MIIWTISVHNSLVPLHTNAKQLVIALEKFSWSKIHSILSDDLAINRYPS